MGAPAGDAIWAHAVLSEMATVPVFRFLAQTSNLPVVFNLKTRHHLIKN